jgi:thiol-disulfide isomerase/thioredoxin
MLHQARLILLLSAGSVLVLPPAARGEAPPTATPPPSASPSASPSGSGAPPAPPPVAPKVIDISPVSDQDYVQRVVAPRRGKVVLVSFWASYCLPCLDEMPGLLALKKKLAPRGADIVLVNVDPPGPGDQLQKVAARRKLPAFETLQVTNDDPQPFIDLVDKKWAGEVPYAVIYGRDGTLRKAFSGEQKIADFERALEEVLRAP